MGVSEDTMMRPTRDNRVPTTTAGRNQPAKTLRGHWRHLWVVWVGLVSTTGLSPGEIYTAARPAGSPSGVGWVGGCRAFREEATRGWPPGSTPGSSGRLWTSPPVDLGC